MKLFFRFRKTASPLRGLSEKRRDVFAESSFAIVKGDLVQATAGQWVFLEIKQVHVREGLFNELLP
jgi:hypothetical protein